MPKKPISPKRLKIATEIRNEMLQGREYTELEIHELTGVSGSRVVEIIRYEPLWTPVPDARKTSVYWITPLERERFSSDRDSQIKEQKALLHKNRYLSLRGRLVEEMITPGGMDRMKTLFNQALERAEAANDSEAIKKDSDK